MMEEVLEYFYMIIAIFVIAIVAIVTIYIYDGIHKIVRDIYYRIERRKRRKEEADENNVRTVHEKPTRKE